MSEPGDRDFDLGFRVVRQRVTMSSGRDPTVMVLVKRRGYTTEVQAAH